MTGAGRKFLAGVVTALACLAILVTLLAHYASNISGDSGGFADRAISVVRTPGVESLIAGTLTDRLADTGGDTSAQQLIQDAVQEAVGSSQVAAELRAAATSLQSQLLSGTATRLTLTLPDLGPALASSIEARSPLLADQVRSLGTITIVDVAIPASDAGAIHDVADVGRDSTLLLILSVALIALALLISPDRARTLRTLGLGVALSGLLAAAVYLLGRGIVVNEFSSEDARVAGSAVWSTYLDGLEVWGFALAGVGVAIALLAATQIRGHPVRDHRYRR